MKKAIFTFFALFLAYYSFAQVAAPSRADSAQTFTMIEAYPQFAGGITGYQAFVAKNVRYPKKARKEKASGQVMVSFVIDTFGRVTEARVEKPVHPALDAEALRVAKLTSGYWSPARQNGKKVKFRHRMPIIFNLEES